MEVDSAAAEASSWQLEEVLACSEDETLDVGGEEEAAGLPFDAAEGEDSDDEPSPAGGAGLWDPSLGEIATLEEEIKKLEFPNLEDGTGNFGEKTMDNAVAMLMAKTGRGFSLKRENKTKVGCEFHLGLWWGADMNTPQVAKTKPGRNGRPSGCAGTLVCGKLQDQAPANVQLRPERSEVRAVQPARHGGH
ncbi:expressed unknown protein [Ectocarpus siliculosus]|uniref:Uncharacterized protein n=1 Tax=Ectocarpus siliculosus TaxID=2880 RepID=D7G3X1_ECTSI|nr:expressed unknown protein [Ectocarpus siliculosus]|eukprot:CBJ33648.1 expressed unknown protein [Ectocarpus siliculosus]